MINKKSPAPVKRKTPKYKIASPNLQQLKKRIFLEDLKKNLEDLIEECYDEQKRCPDLPTKVVDEIKCNLYLREIKEFQRFKIEAFNQFRMNKFDIKNFDNLIHQTLFPLWKVMPDIMFDKDEKRMKLLFTVEELIVRSIHLHLRDLESKILKDKSKIKNLKEEWFEIKSEIEKIWDNEIGELFSHKAFNEIHICTPFFFQE